MELGIWKSVDTQSDLEELGTFLPDHDKETLEFYGTYANESYFPKDLSLSGHRYKNLHLLVRVSGPRGFAYLELVFIACEYISGTFLDDVHVLGRLDSLKRLEGSDVKCARLIYRWVDEPASGRYFGR